MAFQDLWRHLVFVSSRFSHLEVFEKLWISQFRRWMRRQGILNHPLLAEVNGEASPTKPRTASFLLCVTGRPFLSLLEEDIKVRLISRSKHHRGRAYSYTACVSLRIRSPDRALARYVHTGNSDSLDDHGPWLIPNRRRRFNGQFAYARAAAALKSP